MLDPQLGVTAKPLNSRQQDGNYFIDLSQTLPSGRLAAGQKIVSRTLTIDNPDRLIADFNASIYAIPANVPSPLINSTPVTTARVGDVYRYQLIARPANTSTNLGYLLTTAPTGMTIDPTTGLINWLPTATSNADTKISICVYDTQGTYSEQSYRINVSGGNNVPIIEGLPTLINGAEGQKLTLKITASDLDATQTLQYWADNLPGGATFNPITHTLNWTPNDGSAGTYNNIEFYVSDGIETVKQTVNIVIAATNQAPILNPIANRIAQEGEKIVIKLTGSDSDSQTLTYSSNLLPAGATLDPTTGRFEWTPSYFQAGEFTIPFQISDGTTTIKTSTKITVTNANAAPIFDKLDNFTIPVGQPLQFRAFALDPDNPGYIPQEPGLTGYNLPDFATFIDNGNGTGTLRVNPDLNTDAGNYTINLTATENRPYILGEEHTSTTNFVISVDAPNDRPKFNYYQGDTIAIVGEEISLPISVTDKNQDNLTFSINGLPSNATITPSTVYGKAILKWTPTPSDIGNYPVTITVTDTPTPRIPNTPTPTPLSNTQTFNLIVRDTNTAPLLNIVGNKSIAEESTLTFQLTGSDIDGDRLTYTANNLPTGAILNPRTAVFSWQPTAGQAGNYQIEFTTTDGNKRSSETINLTVNRTNHNPILTQLPLQRGIESQFLKFSLAGNDVDRDTLIYTILNVTKDSIALPIPTGAYLDQKTGKFAWKPNYNQAGEYTFKFALLDAYGGVDTKDVRILIDNVNRQPTLNVSNHATTLGNELRFNLLGNDLDLNTQLTYTAEDLPPGATLNATTGEFKWNPNPGQLGDYTVKFTVSDGNLTAFKAVVIKAATSIAAPKLTLDLTPSFPVIVGQKVVVNALADSIANIADVKVKVDGTLVDTFKYNSARNGGSFDFSSTQTGRHELEITATDVDGRSSKIERVIKVKDTRDTLAPIVEFATGLNGSKLTSDTNIIGKVADTNLDEWKLEISTLGTDEHRVITSANNPINDLANLTSLNPQTLANGFYELKLTGTDISGRTSISTAIVEVNTPTKSGYQNTTTDLALTLGGIPVNITRRYDANTGKWTFNTDTNIQLNLPNTPTPPLPNSSPPLEINTRLYLTTPTGERVGFTFTPVRQQITGAVYYTPKWIADSGVNYTLQSVDTKLKLAGSKFYDLGTGIAYNPGSGSFNGTEYTLTALDGTKYLLDAQQGLVGQIATNGTKLIYSDSGITATPAPTPDTPKPTPYIFQFLKDKAGNIAQINAPDQTQLNYEYNPQGQLVSVRNSGTAQTQNYGYETGSTTAQNSAIQRLNVIATNTSGSVINYSGTGFTTESITRNLGGVSNFNGKTISTTADLRQIYSFNLKASELNTTNSHTILIGLEGTGSARINGIAPVYTSGNYRIFAVDKAGINLLEITNPGSTFKLSLVGDLNSDNRVDGLDTQLLTSNSIDLNRDGVSNTQDLQLLGGNYGFIGNSAPVITPVAGLTHTDLTTRIDLSKLAVDSEGDKISFSVRAGVNGRVELSANGEYAIFTPNSGVSGTGSFELIASDEFASSQATIDVNISNAALINLDIKNRNPKLTAGDKYQLEFTGDFVDQKGVSLSADYLTYGIINSSQPSVISVDNRGLITAINNGTGVISASRNGVSAFTASRVGKFNPQTDNELNVSLAEQKGLDVYPNTVTLTPGIERKILVGIGNIYQSPTPDLRSGSTGTQYFVSNPNVLQVNADGLITTLQEGFATVTVINGAAEAVIPVQVQSPYIGATVLGKDGGIVRGVDGSLVMVGANTLSENTTVNIIPIAQSVFSLPIPTSNDLQIVGSFHLDLGSKALNEPVQLAIPAPVGLAAGTEVAFLRESSYLNETGQWTPAWSLDEIGIVGNDGMIRTQSPPLPGINRTGNYVMAAALNYSFTRTRLQWDPDVLGALRGLVVAGVGVAAVLNPGSVVPVILSLAATLLIPELLSDPLSKVNFRNPAAVADLAGLAGAAATGLGIGLTITSLLRNRDVTSSLKIYQAPPIGLPNVTELGVELNSTGVYQIKSVNQLPTVSQINPIAPPVIESAEVKFIGSGTQKNPLLFITGSNFLNGTNNLGDNFQDLVVDFQVGKNTYSSSDIVIDQSTSLGGNRYRIAVKVPTTVALSEAGITLKRRQREQTGSEQSDFIEVEIKSPRQIWLEQPEVEYALVAKRWADRVDLIDLANPQLNTTDGTQNLLAASIPVTTVGQTAFNGNGPRAVASTSDAGRAYVILDGGQVALIDLLTWRRVDGYIPLPAGVSPNAIAIDRQDRYAYVSDSKPNGGIYVIDIQPSSVTYNQVIQRIDYVSANNGFRDLAINSDGRRLYATSNNNADGKSRIIVIDIDPQQRTTNILQWNRKIAEIVTDYQGSSLPNLAGISATGDPNKMTFTQGSENAYGLGYLNVTNDDSANFTVELKYTSINTANRSSIDRNYYVLSKAKDAVITRDGEYGFVLTTDGYQQGRGFDTIDNRFATSIGIIKDPLTPNAKLVAATRPIPFGDGVGLTLSSNDRYLSVTYPGVDGVFVFDVTEIKTTLGNINSVSSPYRIDSKGRGQGSPDYDPLTSREVIPKDLATIPIDDINIRIDTAANYQVIPVSPDGLSRTDWNENFVFGAPPGVKNAPIGITGNPRGITTAAHKDWVKLHVPNTTDIIDLNPNPTIATLNPTLSWELTQNLTLSKVKEVNLFISVFDRGQGLLPEDTWDTLNIGQDYNPNRVLTATWKDGTWSWANITNQGSFNTFMLPTDRILTAGQDYYWAVRVTDKTGNYQDDFGEFKTKLATQSTGDANSFQSVTILTTGLEYNPQAFNQDIQQIADRITNYNRDGLSLYYEEKTSRWYWLDANNQKQFNIPNDKLTKPLVLIPELQLLPETNSLNSAWAEAAADALFASIVSLDQQYGGTVGMRDGAGNLTALYDNRGNLIRKQGKVLNSHLHFVGVGQGAVINSEIIQRLGTYFPYAGGATYIDGTTGELRPVTDTNGRVLRDLQMTTLDPHDFTQNSLGTSWRVINEPEIKVWSNVTFADNYYQTLGNTTYTRSGRAIVPQDASDLNGADVNVNLNSYQGFMLDEGQNKAHLNTLAWYAGTVNLNLGQIPPSSNGSKIYRRLGDLDSTNPNVTHDETWYSPSYRGYQPVHGSKFAPWEGIGTGWFLSALGGGYTNNLRPNHVTTGVPVSFDNTSQARMRGDYAVPTLFDGNFDVISQKLNQQTVPGWSLYNGTGNPDTLQGRLQLWSTILPDNSPDRIVYAATAGNNYALQLNNGQSITHNDFIVPDWGNLRFDIYAPIRSGKLTVSIESEGLTTPIQTIIDLDTDATIPLDSDNKPVLEPVTPDNTLYQQLTNIYKRTETQIGYGRTGFETFQLKLDSVAAVNLRGKSAKVKFSMDNGSYVYLDNIFFKSNNLSLGNITEARWDTNPAGQYGNNLLLEKPQYVVSYNESRKNPNWSAWKIDNTWIGQYQRRLNTDFFADPSLPNLNLPNGFSGYDGDVFRNTKMDKGHLTPDRDRNRNVKDQLATFLTTNVIPQALDNNRYFVDTLSSNPQNFIEGSAWFNLERNVFDRVITSNRQYYVINGAFENNWASQKTTNVPYLLDQTRDGVYINRGNTNPRFLETRGINIPNWTWKVILPVDGNNDPTGAFAYLIPNQAEPDWPNVPVEGVTNPLNLLGIRRSNITSELAWRTPITWQIALSELQNILNNQSDLPKFNFNAVYENLLSLGQYTPN